MELLQNNKVGIPGRHRVSWFNMPRYWPGIVFLAPLSSGDTALFFQVKYGISKINYCLMSS